MRKTNLARLLARRPDGIFVAPLEKGEIGPDLFRRACEFGLEGSVSKRRDRPYLEELLTCTVCGPARRPAPETPKPPSARRTPCQR